MYECEGSSKDERGVVLIFIVFLHRALCDLLKCRGSITTKCCCTFENFHL